MGFILLIALPCLPQVKEITRDEFWNPLYEARNESKKLNRREIRKVETIDKGRVAKVERWNSDHLMPDRSRIVHTVTERNKTSKTEYISIGYSEFCRKDNGEWLLEDCREMTLSSGPTPTTTKYTMTPATHKGRTAKLYVEYKEYAWAKSSRYREFKYWLNDEGKIVGESVTEGIIKPRSVTYRMNARVEYDPKNLKIDAPVKLGDPTIK